MLAVDDMIKCLINSRADSGELRNTYIVFTSDNGWTMGEHRRKSGKGSAYEKDISVPLIVRGPNVPEGKVRGHVVLNNDLAPTFAQLGRASAPSFVDGRSFVPLLRSSHRQSLPGARLYSWRATPARARIARCTKHCEPKIAPG